jgi:predicted metal-dependent hydrolase
MFELLMILVHVVCKPTEAVNAVLEDNKAWLEQQMREIETQGMIGELYK